MGPGNEPSLTKQSEKLALPVTTFRAQAQQKEPADPTWLEKTGGYLGTFGDFFGSVVNPILTFGTLVALAITILMQRVQLREAREDAKDSGAHPRDRQSREKSKNWNMYGHQATSRRNASFQGASISVVRSR